MMFVWMFLEFFKIGSFAFGGGLITLPFMFELGERREWFSKEYLADAIALSQSIPGALGVNVAMFAGLETAGIFGGIVAAVALILPALIVIMVLAEFLKKYGNHEVFQDVLKGILSAAVALILMATWLIADLAIVNILSAVLCLLFFVFLQVYKKINIALFFLLAAIVGIALGHFGLL